MPITGEVKIAKSLGYAGNDKRIWSACAMCGVARWTVRSGDGTPRNKHCSNLPYHIKSESRN